MPQKNDNSLTVLEMDLDVFRQSILARAEFTNSLEKDIFNYELIKDKSLDVQLEYYKTAKTSLIKDLELLKSIPKQTNTKDDMLLGLISTLEEDEKEELLQALTTIIKNRSNKR